MRVVFHTIWIFGDDNLSLGWFAGTELVFCPNSKPVMCAFPELLSHIREASGKAC